MDQSFGPDTGSLRDPRDFTEELNAAEERLTELVRSLVRDKRDFALVAHQADWHVRGVLHHSRNVLANYCEFAAGAAGRAIASEKHKPDVIIMYAPMFQTMMVEFYALVNLSKITLDNLRLFLRPVFETDFGRLPKSVRGFIEGTTDCPVYARVTSNPVLEYLMDLRNCLVHFRTFATSDNAVVVGDHLTEVEAADVLSDKKWFDPMARACFRVMPEGVSVNVLLPDRIFDHSGAVEKMVQFTYVDRINLLGQAMRFARLVCGAISDAYQVLGDPGEQRFTFAKRS